MRFLNGHTIRDAITGLSAAVEARKQTPTGNALNVQIGPGDPISNIPVVVTTPPPKGGGVVTIGFNWYEDLGL